MRRAAFLAASALVALHAVPAAAVAGPALLLEADSGKVLYAEDADNQWYPASLTKIMTAYLTFEALKAGRIALDTKITVSEAAHLQPPSKVGLPVGGEITVELALKALIVKSANDVAVMLAEAIGGSEAAFIERMNTTARRLGMSRTRFANPNGLPSADQVTTARDLARLSRAVLRDFPDYAHYWAMPDIQIGKRRLGTHNSLLKSYEGADGLKTGFICDSGFNVVATASRDGKRLMAVVLGEPTGRERALRAASLLEHGFQMSGWKSLFNTASLDNLPLSPEAKGPVSMRETVMAWDCNPKARARAVAAARAAAKKQRTEQAAAKAAKQAQAAGSSAAGQTAPASKSAAAPAGPSAPATTATVQPKPKPKAAAAASPPATTPATTPAAKAQ